MPRYFEKLTIYGKEACQPCVNLCAYLDEQEVDYNYVNTSADEKELEYLKAYSMTFPTAFYQQGIISGSRAIKEIALGLVKVIDPAPAKDVKIPKIYKEPPVECEACQ